MCRSHGHNMGYKRYKRNLPFSQRARRQGTTVHDLMSTAGRSKFLTLHKCDVALEDRRRQTERRQ